MLETVLGNILLLQYKHEANDFLVFVFKLVWAYVVCVFFFKTADYTVANLHYFFSNHHTPVLPWMEIRSEKKKKTFCRGESECACLIKCGYVSNLPIC